MVSGYAREKKMKLTLILFSLKSNLIDSMTIPPFPILKVTVINHI